MLQFHPAFAIKNIGNGDVVKEIIKMAKQKNNDEHKTAKELEEEYQQKIKYKEKVRAYTTIEVGSKKPDHLEIYSLK